MKHFLLIIALLFSISASAEVADSLVVDSVATKRGNFFQRTVTKGLEQIDRLLFVDTAFIEPNHYNFQTMMRNNYTYEVYRLGDDKGNNIRFAPKPSVKIGPYIGWKFIFLGWSVDLAYKTDNSRRKEFDMSFYTMPFGFDLFYRQTGDNYRIKEININSDYDFSPLEGQPFSGVESKVTGLSGYYIFNHWRFSYPAAFNQSTRQKLSCGSAIAGIGYTRHSLTVDWEQLNSLSLETTGHGLANDFTADKLLEKVRYSDFSISGGYAYNWVFAKNWLFCSSLSLALSYKRAVSDYETSRLGTMLETLSFRDFSITSLNIDGVGRFSINWTNDHWFAGATAKLHSFNYNKPEFYTNNTFGSVSIFAGVNFGRKKTHPQPSL